MRPSLAPGSPPRSIDPRGSGLRSIDPRNSGPRGIDPRAIDPMHERRPFACRTASRPKLTKGPCSDGRPRVAATHHTLAGGVAGVSTLGSSWARPRIHPRPTRTHIPLTRGRDSRQFPRVGRWAHPTLTRGRDQSAEPGVNLPASAHAHPHEGDMTNQQNLGSTRARIPPPTRGRAVPRAQVSTRTRASMSALSAPTSFSRSMTRCCPPSIPSNLSGTGGR